jgi:hypothetical protein
MRQQADELERQRTAELERRIQALEQLDDASLGRFTAWDWLACVLGGVVGPVLALWWFAG